MAEDKTKLSAPGYNDKLDPDDQISMEELIASIIRNQQEMETQNSKDNGGTDFSLTDEDCQDLGRRILLNVLHKFRPDLVKT